MLISRRFVFNKLIFDTKTQTKSLYFLTTILQFSKSCKIQVSQNIGTSNLQN